MRGREKRDGGMEGRKGRQTLHPLKHTLDRARAAGTGHVDVEFVVVGCFHFSVVSLSVTVASLVWLGEILRW